MRLKFIYFFVNIFMSLYFVKTNKLKEWKVKNKLVSFYSQKKDGVHWQNGIIPYFFDAKSYDHVIANRLRTAMNILESVSCIRFKPVIGYPKTMNSTWLHISNPSLERDCVHDPRQNDNEMLLVFGLDCLSDQQILHTLMHGIGFNDEVSHPQRDQYIRILWNNIQPAYQHLFRIRTGDMTPRGGVEYDPMSIMHFHDRAFSINGRATIAPLISGLVIKPSDSLSQLDTMKLRILFGHECNKRHMNDLLDTCKTILYQDYKMKTELSKSKGDIIAKAVTVGNDTNVVEEPPVEGQNYGVSVSEEIAENTHENVQEDNENQSKDYNAEKEDRQEEKIDNIEKDLEENVKKY